MKIPPTLARIILAVLFFSALGARVVEFRKPEYPYYRGESALHYRYAYMVSKKGHVPELDVKATWPDGYAPARSELLGVEYLTGYVVRLVGYFSEAGGREITATFTALFYSLLVLLIYGLAYSVWNCQAGALFAAFLTALSVPLIQYTSGLTFSHPPFAAPLVFIHLLVLRSYMESNKSISLVVLLIVTFVMLSLWEGSLYYIAFSSLYLVSPFVSKPSTRSAPIFTMVLALAFSVALLPFMRTATTAFSPAACILYASVGYVIIARRRQSAVHSIYVIGVAIVLALLFAPFRSGSDVFLPGLSHLFYRLRFLFGKPADPSLLPEEIRFAWTLDRSYPSAFGLVSLLLPLAILVPPLVDGLKHMQRTGIRAARIAFPVALFLFLGYLLDSSLLVFFAPVAFLCTAPALYSFSRRIVLRGAFLVIAVILVFSQLFGAGGSMDLPRRVAKIAGADESDPRRFVWVSIGNADLDLVRFLTKRTSLRDPILASPDVSPFILTFAGRTTAITPAIHSRKVMGKTIGLLKTFYGTEKELYDACMKEGIRYVLYSIDLLLDDSRYSVRYTAGAEEPSEESIAFQMHFFPEALEHFELIYENDNYRVFKVTERSGPIFLIDHPPVYDYDVYRKFAAPGSFYREVIRIMSMYALAVNERRTGNTGEAKLLYARCLDVFPRFTAASIALGGILLEEERYDEASAVFQRVLSYAPDNPDALFGASLSLYKLGLLQEARKLVNLLINASAEGEIVKKARGLRKMILEELQGANGPTAPSTRRPSDSFR